MSELKSFKVYSSTTLCANPTPMSFQVFNLLKVYHEHLKKVKVCKGLLPKNDVRGPAPSKPLDLLQICRAHGALDTNRNNSQTFFFFSAYPWCHFSVTGCVFLWSDSLVTREILTGTSEPWIPSACIHRDKEEEKYVYTVLSFPPFTVNEESFSCQNAGKDTAFVAQFLASWCIQVSTLISSVRLETKNTNKMKPLIFQWLLNNTWLKRVTSRYYQLNKQKRNTRQT